MHPDEAAAMDRQHAANCRHRAQQMREQGCNTDMIEQELFAAQHYTWRAQSWHQDNPPPPPLPRTI